jgi:endonuclease/exonuclease/phosphatase family metal-dependent hydrolase
MGRHSRLVVVLLVLASLALGSVASAAPRFDPPVGPERTLRVMTRNVYFGADLGPVIEAAGTGDAQAVLAAAAGAYIEAYESDFAFRAAAIADEIASERPALVGLQESTVWDAVPLGPDALLLQVDFLDLILKELADRGLHYTVVEEIAGFDATLPLPVPGINVMASLTISDVLLRDASIPSADLRVRRVTSDHYDAQVPPLVLPGGLPPLPFPRQWIAADVIVRGEAARVITTHLESVNGAARVGQAIELLAGPADTDLPTVVLGDLNSEVDGFTADDPLPGSVPDAAHLLVLNGFADLGPEGDTCCQDGDLRNADSDLTSRIDLVLGRGGFSSTDGVRTGVEPLDGSLLEVRYASDHAGVTTTVVLPD